MNILILVVFIHQISSICHVEAKVSKGSNFPDINLERDEHGNYIMDDMIFDEAQIRHYFGNNYDNDAERQAKDQEYRWTNGIIPFKFEDGYPQDKKDLVLCYLEQFNQQMENCVQIREKLDTDKNYVLVRFLDKCSSYVGMLNKGEQYINIGADHCFDTSIIHEFMHSFGIKHEQARPDRDQYVTIHYENIEPEGVHNFDICTNCLTFDLPYDGNSRMHYSAYDYAINSSLPTIESKIPGISTDMLGALIEITKKDEMLLRKMYSCPDVSEPYVPMKSLAKCNICSPSTPCGSDEGNCNSHEDCKGDYLCGVENCGSYWPSGYNCCMRASGSYCSPTEKCHENEGDCDSDDDCQSGLICGKDNCGKNLGYEKSYDCCMKPSLDYCSPTAPCGYGIGNCNSHDDCESYYLCGVQNCGTGWPSGYNCCMRPTSSYCSPESPCYENEGDCDSDADCQGELVCGKDNCGKNLGLDYGRDCCMKPAK